MNVISLCVYLNVINAVGEPVTVITITGGDVIYHEKGFPFHDPGATAQVFLPETHSEHPYKKAIMKTVRSTVPAVCDTLGEYEVQYEAVGPYGLYMIKATRKVIIGQCTYENHLVALDCTWLRLSSVFVCIVETKAKIEITNGDQVYHKVNTNTV